MVQMSVSTTFASVLSKRIRSTMNNLKVFAFGILTCNLRVNPAVYLAPDGKRNAIRFHPVLPFPVRGIGPGKYYGRKERIFPRGQERYPGINIVRFFLYGLRHVPVLGIQFYVGGDRHNAAFHLSGIRNTYHAVVFPGKDILDYLDGDRIGNLRGGTSFDR